MMIDYIEQGHPATMAENLLQDLDTRLKSLGLSDEDAALHVPANLRGEHDRALLAFPQTEQQTPYNTLYHECLPEQRAVWSMPSLTPTDPK